MRSSRKLHTYSKKKRGKSEKRKVPFKGGRNERKSPLGDAGRKGYPERGRSFKEGAPPLIFKKGGEESTSPLTEKKETQKGRPLFLMKGRFAFVVLGREKKGMLQDKEVSPSRNKRERALSRSFLRKRAEGGRFLRERKPSSKKELQEVLLLNRGDLFLRRKGPRRGSP